MPRPLSEEHKAHISEAQKTRYERQRAELPPLIKWRKRCSQCGEMKLVDLEDRKGSEFPVRTRKIATGTTLYPAGECKKCNAARAAAHRQKLREEGKLSEAQKRWNESRDEEARRTYNRLWQARKRREEGVEPRGPWKRYRDGGIKVDAEPFRQWLLGRPGLPWMTPAQERLVRRVVSGEQDRVELVLADEIMTRAGEGWMSTELWPNA